MNAAHGRVGFDTVGRGQTIGEEMTKTLGLVAVLPLTLLACADDCGLHDPLPSELTIDFEDNSGAPVVIDSLEYTRDDGEEGSGNCSDGVCTIILGYLSDDLAGSTFTFDLVVTAGADEHAESLDVSLEDDNPMCGEIQVYPSETVALDI